ncbi:MAG: ParA family protein [Sulfolobaceae archaeon]|nr:ParA family protein [Sulfolobaceae archaeon]
MRLYNLGRSFVITGIIELILAAIYYTSGLIQGANELSYFSYFLPYSGYFNTVNTFKGVIKDELFKKVKLKDQLYKPVNKIKGGGEGDIKLILSTGLKGGIGKTTIAIYLSFGLKKKVLYVDYDYTSFGSLLLGHNDIGLVDELTSNIKPFSRSLKEFQNITVLKVFGDPFNIKIPENANSVLSELIKGLSQEFIIIDSNVNLTPNDEIFKRLDEVSDESFGLFITDPLTLNATTKFAMNWKLSWKALVLNMIPPLPDEINEAINLLEKVRSQFDHFDAFVAVPFDEKLYNYKPDPKINVSNKQLDLLINALLEKRRDYLITPLEASMR